MSATNPICGVDVCCWFEPNDGTMKPDEALNQSVDRYALSEKNTVHLGKLHHANSFRNPFTALFSVGFCAIKLGFFK